MRKKSALAKYQPLMEQGLKGMTAEELIDVLTNDENGYTASESEEIAAALLGGDSKEDDGTAGPDGAEQRPSPATTSKAVAQAEDNGYTLCEEWRVEFINGKPDKLKKLKSNVKLQDHQIEELNGNANAHNPIMYYPQG